jgi:hypothetical protein
LAPAEPATLEALSLAAPKCARKTIPAAVTSRPHRGSGRAWRHSTDAPV